MNALKPSTKPFQVFPQLPKSTRTVLLFANKYALWMDRESLSTLLSCLLKKRDEAGPVPLPFVVKRNLEVLLDDFAKLANVLEAVSFLRF